MTTEKRTEAFNIRTTKALRRAVEQLALRDRQTASGWILAAIEEAVKRAEAAIDKPPSAKRRK